MSNVYSCFVLTKRLYVKAYRHAQFIPNNCKTHAAVRGTRFVICRKSFNESCNYRNQRSVDAISIECVFTVKVRRQT